MTKQSLRSSLSNTKWVVVQRIALARACYSQNDVVVLDSPLSAVDMHTGQHIFKHCIQEMMIANGLTVVLATHQVGAQSKYLWVLILLDVCFKCSIHFSIHN
jgi:ABC-type Mn2+/Zn2+ transport system ATPase subunit